MDTYEGGTRLTIEITEVRMLRWMNGIKLIEKTRGKEKYEQEQVWKT